MAEGDATLPTREIRIHADSLEWTRTGQRTRDSIALETGTHNRVVIVRPKRIAPVPLSAGGFPEGSSFPGPGVLALMLRGLPADDSRLVQVFAHGDPSGSDDANKVLTDRRAQAVGALLRGDVSALLQISKEEQWDLAVQQVMLRALLCDPGPIDGIAESLTKAAVLNFQEQYAAGSFHVDARRNPQVSTLEVDGDLGSDTHEALVDAYVAVFSPRLPASRFHPSHPENGCAGFNPIEGASPVAQRRVSLVLHPAVPAFHERQPCVAGDANACILMDHHQGCCGWFRHHVADPSFDDFEHWHFRPQWLQLANGHFLLSALTTVPDDEEVEFAVHTAVQPVDGAAAPTERILREQLGEVIVNKPVLGVAQVVWVPPPSFAPGQDGRIERDGQRVVPVFRVSHHRTGTVTHDSWPAPEVVVLFLRAATTADGAAPRGRVRLKCAEQAYDIELPISSAGEFDELFDAIRFEGMQPHGAFSLQVAYDETQEWISVYEAVPFGDLDAELPLAPQALHRDGNDAGPEPEGELIEPEERPDLQNLDFSKPWDPSWMG